jgi:para-aminobenzoate synthetase component 1
MGLPGKTPTSVAFEQFCTRMDALGAQGTPFVFIVDFQCKEPVLWEVGEIPEGVLYDFGGFRNSLQTNAPRAQKAEFAKYPVSYDTYLQAFSYAQKNIRRGESFLVNISAPTRIVTGLSLEEIFHQSTARYRFLFKDQFVCFSPEPFVRIEEDAIATFPMKGTIDAALPNAAELVLRNPKETAEHATIVDLLRNDMSRVSDKVWVEKYRYIDTIRTSAKTLLQVSSEIRGQLSPYYTRAFGRILGEMLPAGSVTGAPKPRTIEIIEQAEGYERGYYTGVMGCFDGKTFESAVMIRFIERTSDTLVFKSGGGITAMSDPKSEYEEMIDKVYLPIPASPAEN